jgi:hypothetical protein
MKTNLQTPTLPAADRAEPAEIIRLGKDEMNLAEFPIALLADRVPKGQTSIEFQDKIFDEKSGKTIVRKVTIKAPEEAKGRHGLPTAVDDDVILGLIQLTKMSNSFTSREVEFSRLELIKLLNWPDSGESYRRLGLSLKRWLSVTLIYENAWRDNRKGAWITKGFHILDNIELNDTRTTDEQGELFPSKIVWNKVVFESFESGYLKSLDYGLYIRLKLQTSKRMYRFLSKRMYHGPEVEFDLRDFAITHIGLSPTYGNNAGKLKEKLQPAVEELEAVEFLEPMAKETRYRKCGKNWIIRFVQKGTGEQPIALPSEAKEPLPLVAELTKRGVSGKRAADLVAKHPAETIERHIEVFDWLSQKKPAKISDPGAYLFTAIEQDYAEPKGFVSKAEQKRKHEAKLASQRKDMAEYRRKQAEAEAELEERKRVAAHLESLTADETAELDAKIEAESNFAAIDLPDGPFKELGQRIRREEYIRQMLSVAT